jgi:hypothetical protein
VQAAHRKIYEIRDEVSSRVHDEGRILVGMTGTRKELNTQPRTNAPNLYTSQDQCLDAITVISNHKDEF